MNEHSDVAIYVICGMAFVSLMVAVVVGFLNGLSKRHDQEDNRRG